jgi:hypothetical protein
MLSPGVWASQAETVRTSAMGQLCLAQFRQAVSGRLACYEDVNDSDRLGHDPASRWRPYGSARAWRMTLWIGAERRFG